MKQRNICRKANDRQGWHNFYATRFNKTESNSAAQLSLFYYILMLEENDA